MRAAGRPAGRGVTGPERAVLVTWADQLDRVDGSFGRLYFGAEFCQNALPEADALDRALDVAGARGMAFTLVTPFVTEPGLARVMARVEQVAERLGQFELVVNDFGVLRAVRRALGEQAPALVLGRLQTKLKRGPRIDAAGDRVPAAARDHFRRPNVDVPHYARFLRGLGVTRVELDRPRQGLCREGAHLLPGSLYVPFVYVATGRYCHLARPQDRGRAARAVTSCAGECRELTLELTSRRMPAPLIVRGVSTFYREVWPPGDSEHLAALRVDRLVVQPEAPA